jgi:hypothetical protein
METTNLQVFNPSLPALDKDLKERIIEDAENSRLFAKATDTGEFQIVDDFTKFIVGKVIEVDRFAAMWTDGQIDKLHDFKSEDDLPEGYELRADVTVLTPDYSLVTVSLPPSSYKYQFAPKVKQLEKQGMDITECLVELSVKVVKGKKGTFPVVLFKILQQAPKDPDVIEADDDQIPF